MTKVIYVAPFVKERFKGGIMRIAEMLSKDKIYSNFSNNNIEFEFFNSSIIDQSKNSEGKFVFENIKQAVFLLFSLIERVLKKNFDIIHFNSSMKIALFKDQLIIFFISFLTSKKIYFQIHFSGIEETFLKPYFLKKIQFYLFRRVDKVILLSENFKKELISVGVPERKLTVLYNFHAVEEQQISNCSKSKKVLQLLFIGSISKRKGFEDLLKAIKELNIDYELNVLGDYSSDDMKVSTETFVSENKLKVFFLGYLTGLEKNVVIKNSDILILPSYGEGFPMVIPEAMAFGCAIISTKIAGIPEIVEEGINGYLINPGDIDSLSERIERLHCNREILNSLKENSLKMSTKFKIENYVEKLTNIYSS